MAADDSSGEEFTEIDTSVTRSEIKRLEKENEGIVKSGRTHLQDAVPIRLGAEFGAYSRAISRDIHRMELALEEMYAINLGGTAVGTALNANPQYVDALAPTLSEICGLPLKKADDLVDGTQNLDTFAFVSATLKTAAISCSKRVSVSCFFSYTSASFTASQATWAISSSSWAMAFSSLAAASARQM